RNLSYLCCFFFSSRRRHTRSKRDWSSDVCSSDLGGQGGADPPVVGDRGAVQRHVEVRTDEHALAAQVAERVDGLQHCGSFGSGDERSPPVTDPAGRWPAGSGGGLLVSVTRRGAGGPS